MDFDQARGELGENVPGVNAGRGFSSGAGSREEGKDGRWKRKRRRMPCIPPPRKGFAEADAPPPMIYWPSSFSVISLVRRLMSSVERATIWRSS